MMKRIEVFKESEFSDKGMKKLLIHDSPYFRVLNFNFKSGQELGIHSHDVDVIHHTQDHAFQAISRFVFCNRVTYGLLW